MIDRNVAPNRFHPLLALLIASAALSAAPAVASEDFQVNITTSENQQYSDVAHDTTGRFLIAWTSWPNDPYREMVHRRVYEADGTPATGELAVGSESDVFQLDAHVCGLADGGWVLAWRARTSTDGTGGIRAQRIAADGSPSGSVIVVSSDSLLADTFVRGAVNLDVACLPDGGFFVGYSEGFAPDRESIFEIDVYGRRFDSAGAPLGSSFTVNQDTEGDQGNFGGEQLPGRCIQRRLPRRAGRIGILHAGPALRARRNARRRVSRQHHHRGNAGKSRSRGGLRR
jgi:hypothetical protein